VALVERSRGSDDLEAYRGLLYGSCWPVGIGLGAFLLSLAGVPGLVGFPAKLHVFQAAAESGFDGVAAVAVLNIGLAGAAYGRVIRRMFERADGEAAVRIRAYDVCFVAVLAAGTVALGLHQAPLLDLAKRSIHLLPR
jgi:NADH-quinone oxidoreductase subunit N